MAAYKQTGTNTWRVVYRTTDWKGDSKQTSKRGFPTKRDALEWEREQLRKAQSDLSMTFEAFFELYSRDMKSRLRLNTWKTKEGIIKTKLMPYFGNKRMDDISAKDIIQWQNEMIMSNLVSVNFIKIVMMPFVPYPTPLYQPVPRSKRHALPSVVRHRLPSISFGCSSTQGNNGK